MPLIPPEKRARFDHAARVARSARIRVEAPFSPSLSRSISRDALYRDGGLEFRELPEGG